MGLKATVRTQPVGTNPCREIPLGPSPKLSSEFEIRDQWTREICQGLGVPSEFLGIPSPFDPDSWELGPWEDYPRDITIRVAPRDSSEDPNPGGLR